MKRIFLTLLLLSVPAFLPLQALAVQSSLWGSFAYGLSPMPEKIDSTSQTKIGGFGGGADLSVQFFFPFYFGIVADYFPIYAESVVFDFP